MFPGDSASELCGLVSSLLLKETIAITPNRGGGGGGIASSQGLFLRGIS